MVVGFDPENATRASDALSRWCRQLTAANDEVESVCAGLEFGEEGSVSTRFEGLNHRAKTLATRIDDVRRRVELADAPPLCSGVGDPAGSGTATVRAPWTILGVTPVDRGRAVLDRALADTANPCVIERDEFEIVRAGAGTYIVVLPGVVDLSTPQVGLDRESASPRDLDKGAARSWLNPSIRNNIYAQAVVASLAARVPAGSSLALVGHSFGADTALDLAADPTINGGRYRVSHVMAAGYDGAPTLDHIPPRTEVLIVNNRHDAVVGVEQFGRLATLWSLPFGRQVRSTIRTSRHRKHRTVSFAGGLGRDAGHHPNRYRRFIASTSNTAVVEFAASLDAAGYSRADRSVAVDISVANS